MKKRITLRRWWVTALVGCVVPVFLHAEANKHRTVVVISLDGFPAYALDDPRLPIPTLRKLVREGVAATSMRPVNPTVTWPNHTAIVTGVDASEHHVLFNGLLTRPDGGGRPSIEPWRDKDTMVHAPTIYDIAHEAGLTTAQVDWVAIYRAKTITWQFPELPDPNGVIERELIAEGTVTAEQLRTFEDSSQAWQDEIWTAAAEEILEKHKPNLLLFHLLTLDDTNHEYGPMSPASFTAMAFLDAKVKQILDVLRRTGLSRNAILIVVSDHGFRNFKHKIHPNVLLRKKGLLSEGPGQPKGDAWVLSEGGTAVVYVTNPDRKASVVSELRNILTGAEGIDHVYGVEDFPKLGYPLPTVTDQAPDLVLAAVPDYMFSNGIIRTDSRVAVRNASWSATEKLPCVHCSHSLRRIFCQRCDLQDVWYRTLLLALIWFSNLRSGPWRGAISELPNGWELSRPSVSVPCAIANSKFL